MISNGMRLLVIASVLAFAYLCAGQEGPKAIPIGRVSQPTSGTSTDDKKEADRSSAQTWDSRYQFYPSDSLAVIFPLTPEFNQPAVTVQPDGNVTLQVRP